jgi:hypothetical protein
MQALHSSISSDQTWQTSFGGIILRDSKRELTCTPLYESQTSWTGPAMSPGDGKEGGEQARYEQDAMQAFNYRESSLGI